MELQICEHPKRIYNKYTKEFQYVPCGKCASCLRSRASKWIERLNVERRCWKYCLFFTLTYSDDFVPRLTKIGKSHLVDLTHLHQDPQKPAPCIDLEEIMSTLSSHERNKLQSYLDKNDWFSYLSVYDAQCFIKRLRKNLYNTIKLKFPIYEQKDYQVRYYLIGEYGPTTKRCHMHGLLFFSSEKEASCIEECVSKSWKFGITDTSFVAESNAPYLAKYLNCSTGLPAFYEHKSVRPFAIFSKSVPLGTLYFNEETVRKIFDTSSPRMLVDYFKGLSLSDVPLWRTYQDRLFPRLSLYSQLTSFDRVTLYRAVANLENKFGREISSPDFVSFMLDRHNRKYFDALYLHCYDDYITALLDYSRQLATDPKTFEVDQFKANNTLLDCVKRWCFISHRVCTQAAAFDVTIEEYVDHISVFYDNLELDKLKGYFDFQSEYMKENTSPAALVGLDRLWLESVLDVPFELMSAEELTILESFKILDLSSDVGTDTPYIKSDNTLREVYNDILLPENSRSYQKVVLDNVNWMKKHTKNKIKNDYLQAHPDLMYKVSDLLT